MSNRDSPEDYELFHYGVKGMRWGVRRKNKDARGSSEPATPSKVRKSSDLSKAERKTAEKIMKKNWVKDYNATAEYANREIIPKINKKYKGKVLLDSTGQYNEVGRKYVQEHTSAFNKKLREIQSETIRNKTGGSINLRLQDEEE